MLKTTNNAEPRTIGEISEPMGGRDEILAEELRRVKSSVARLELTELPKISVALDVLSANDDALRQLEQRITRLEHEMGRQAIQLVAAQIVN